MRVSSNIVATSNELTRYFLLDVTKIAEDLTLPNPEYVNQTRFGRKGSFYKKVDKNICYLKKTGDNYIVPRFYAPLPVGIKDETVSGRKLTSSSKIVLRDYQKEFVDANSDKFNHQGLLIEAACGSGKCHGKGTKILMYDGSIKNVEDIVVGDLLMGDDSTPRKVLSLARGREEMFVIHQNKGEDYTVNKSHILSLQYRPWGSKNKIKSRHRYAHEHYGEKQDINLVDYLDFSKYKKAQYYGYCVPVDFPEAELPFSPYLLGCWLGDGTSKEISFTCHKNDRKLISYYKEVSKKYGLTFRRFKQINRDGSRNNSNLYRLVGSRDNQGHFYNPLFVLFQKECLINNKHIPEKFLVNSRHNRLELLAGLIDTDGYVRKGTVEITQKRKSLIEQIQRLCWSLGFKATISEKVIDKVSYWKLSIIGNVHEIPVRLLRKKLPPRSINKDPYVTGISIESIGEGDYYGFTLDGNHRYCLQDGTVTHNTIMGIWLSYEHGVQTMVLVPTYYLAKQWKQRIEETTNASVFILTAKDKEIPTQADFTIVVMDLFSSRVLPEELVNNVGHVILDEAHRVGAETYLPILEELPARYRTALTATFRRSDGVHRILKYHFGEHLQMKSRFPRPHIYGVFTGVEVRGILSKNRPHDKFVDFLDSLNVPYHETKSAVCVVPDKRWTELADKMLSSKQINKTSYRQICSCISKVSKLAYPTIEAYLNDHSGRRKQVISIIQDALDKGRTVLFLSKRKDTLRSLYKYFADYKPMLIVSETSERTAEEEEYLQTKCPLILGVSQLAKEGLDIDRLDTLILHLPIKDTEQAVGRICRLHPDKKQAVALYLVDNCPMTFATYSSAKKTYFPINGKFMGERNLQTIKTVL